MVVREDDSGWLQPPRTYSASSVSRPSYVGYGVGMVLFLVLRRVRLQPGEVKSCRQLSGGLGSKIR